MALSTTTFCLVLGCLTLSLFHYSSGTKKENQFCGDEKFYCPTNNRCFDRKLRCTSSKVCVDSNNNEAKCFESSTPGMYNYWKKTSPLSSSGSSSKRKRSVFDYEVKHWYVDYRGFVYEFGKGYSVQELDVNDPNYKYAGKENPKSAEFMGSSSCTRDEVKNFADKWLRANPDYKWYSNNCQDFAKKLLEELKKNCPKDDDTESLKAPSQCFSNTSSSFRWKLHALFAPLISFAIFHNIN